jgi:tetratricopeptide (TPR) repeat protein
LQNTLAMAREMAHFFGTPNEPGATTVMGPEPTDARFSSRASTLIHRLRRYDFKHGVSGLEGSWGPAALDALTEAGKGVYSNPLAQAHELIAAAFVIDGRYAPGIQHLQSAVKADPKSTAARLQLAAALMQDTQPDAAAAAMRDAIQLDPNDPKLHRMLGLMMARKDFEGALLEYQAAVRLDPKSPQLHEALGTVLIGGMGRIDVAIAEFQEALRLSPNFRAAQIGLERAQAAKQQAAENAAELSRRASANPNGNLLFELGVAEMRAGNLDAGVKALNKSVEMNPKPARTHTALALAYYVRGNYGAAQAEIGKAKALGNAAPQELEAVIQAKAGGR